MKLLKFFILMLISNLSLAQTIQVTADSVQIKNEGINVYQGNAKMFQGNKSIFGYKIIVKTKNQKIQSLQIIGNHENPAKIHIKTKKSIKAQAIEINYNPEKEIFLLNGNAELSQQHSKITAEKIIYNIKTKTIQANSGDKEQVTTKFSNQ